MYIYQTTFLKNTLLYHFKLLLSYISQKNSSYLTFCIQIMLILLNMTYCSHCHKVNIITFQIIIIIFLTYNYVYILNIILQTLT